MAFFKQTFIDGVTVVTAAWLNGIQEVVGAEAVAPEYSPNQTYAKDSLVAHDGKLYTNPNAIAAPEPWTAGHWTETSLQALLDSKANAFDTITNDQIDALYG